MEKVICAISKSFYDAVECYKFNLLHKPLADYIKLDFPDIQDSDYVSIEQVTAYRKKYLISLIEQERGDVNLLEKKVFEAIAKNQILTENVELEISDELTSGQKLADKIALFGGSWSFIIFFFAFIIIWMLLNIILLSAKAFDPYPFILLNLILSCIAAIQAPIIMMSQNRKEEKDRKRSENDYKVNLKAELEIQLLHEKLDHLIIHQNKKLLEIQELQVEFFDDAVKRLKNNNH